MRKIDENYEVVDAKNKVLGRVASTVAKKLLDGKSIAVINSEYAIITGSRRDTIEKYRIRLNLQEKENPEHSPYWSRRPDMLVRRIIRGMLPYARPRGKDAYRRLFVYRGEPQELKGLKTIEVTTKNPKSIYVGHLTVGELSRLLGYTK